MFYLDALQVFNDLTPYITGHIIIENIYYRVDQVEFTEMYHCT